MDDVAKQIISISAPVEMNTKERSELGGEISLLYIRIRKTEEELKVYNESVKLQVKGMYEELKQKSLQLNDGQIFKTFECHSEFGSDPEMGEVVIYRDIASGTIIQKKPIDKDIYEKKLLVDLSESVENNDLFPKEDIIPEHVRELELFPTEENTAPAGPRPIEFDENETPPPPPDEPIVEDDLPF